MRRGGFGVAEVVVTAAVLMILTIILWPVFAPVRTVTHKTSCISNIKQCGMTLIMYGADYDDLWPDRDRWVDLTFPYSKNDFIYHCPELRPWKKEIYGYAFNSWLAPRKATALVDPAAVPMLYDSINFAKNASDPFLSFAPWPAKDEKPRRIVGFADGHAKYEAAGWKGWMP